MDFHILGPLEVYDDGHPVPLGGPRQRALLALLLLHANRAVTTEQLHDAQWVETLPGTGLGALPVRIPQLGRSLVPVRGDAALVTRPPDYSLLVDDEQVDARRSERLLAAGKDALAGGQPAVAADTLRAALGLWRGPALADLAGEPFAQSEAARLEELRLAALEARIEAELALGLH